MGKWTGLEKPITAADAEAEPEADRLFGPSYDARQRRLTQRSQPDGIDCASYTPWRKPRMERKEAANRGEPARIGGGT
jgi:hypothetical protein